MTDKQRLALVRQAQRELVLTTNFDPKGGHWRRAFGALQALEDDLAEQPEVPKVPDLGPVWRGGKSILLHDLTHATGGIPLYPAFDDAFVAGCKIIAPEAITVTKQSSSRPGDAFYAKGASKIRYWFAHLVSAPATGRKFRKSETIGVVLDHDIGGGPHVHVGIIVEDLLGRGKQLEYHTNYTHGGGLIGDQLREELKDV